MSSLDKASDAYQLKARESGFTMDPYALKPHKARMRRAGLGAHVDMLETIISEFNGRKKYWAKTTKYLMQKFVADTGLEAPAQRRTQINIDDLERFGLIRRYCARTKVQLNQLSPEDDLKARKYSLGMHYKVAGLDFPLPTGFEYLERRHRKRTSKPTPVTTSDRRPLNPPLSSGDHSLRSPKGDPSLLDGSLNDYPPLPPIRHAQAEPRA